MSRTGWQYYLARGISKLICQFSYERIIAWGRKLGPLGEKILHKQRERGIRHIMQGLACTQKEAETIIAAVFANLGQSLLEILYTPQLCKENIHTFVTLEHEERLQQALDKNKGVIVLTAHFGNWEWMGAALSLYGYPTTTIVKNQPNDQLTRLLNEHRRMMGLEVFERGGNAMIIAARALRRKKILGFLADQDGGEDGVPDEFLGKFASSPKGPAQFYCKFGSPIVPIFAIHDEQHHHRVLIGKEIAYEPTGDTTKDIAEVTRLLTAETARLIQTYPAEWLWFQHRWRTQQASMHTES
ncbi:MULTISPECIES: lysophospholipid acyltransferase family protein [Megasphaera]|uniref:Lipid A biosynthesis (KDO)2-(Lauroyl)-lipid IVA acyltransferase n=1 Tax=Megasphaera hutchinsoni TaxID=1588748 RepID=A0A134CLH1_9FIRM|nr:MULTISPECIES: lysophospholipid acyltransferase family protein [Megasphaera]EGS32772.1 lipid A biosynthesis (KDO)2-(lauroyl)-lipid IVA acyltransferase [Megasphaera sp. UPII 135-E]KXB92984.1 lipid A biosynthesis (KDO)2-(lauroyl)-lipid IVA acyltransferase [Megasphaera hutchinsoni]MUP48180.1 lipid A biosynthesis acyltransferase [Veillonellaceae bacterium M2-8]MUP58743.1 lipid A biosynthesis acyltransferase [Veillonellaceae bacterium M2-4]